MKNGLLLLRVFIFLLSLLSCTNQKNLNTDPFGIAENMVYVEGGTFSRTTKNDQSNDSPDRNVSVSSFYISKYEVTQAQWMAIMGYNPSNFTGNLQQAVEMVSWMDCQTFIKRLNEKTGKKYRLPTEAEWEYAARGGQKSKAYQYAGGNEIEKVAWYSKNAVGRSHVVGKKQPNELGLYDMSGNVWEWCADKFYKNTSTKQNDRLAKKRTLRGGSWSNGADQCTIKHRYAYYPESAFSLIGFRLVCD